VAANIYQAVKQAMQDLIAPQLEALKGDIGELRAELHGEIGTVRAEIGQLRAEMRGEIGALGSEIRRVDDKLTWALDLRERIVALETKLAVERP
jgi:HAMP domain-containing protein